VHQVSDNHYIVVSANPLTRPLKTYNLEAYDRITPALQFQAFVQETAFGHGFSQPLSASAFASYRLTPALPHSFLQLSDVQYYQSLLARPSTFRYRPSGPVYYYEDPSHDFIPDHPNTVSNSVVGRLPPSARPPAAQFSVALVVRRYRQRADAAAVARRRELSQGVLQGRRRQPHDQDPDDAWPTGRVATAICTLPEPLDKQRQWFSLPHHVDTTVASIAHQGLRPAGHDPGDYQNINTSDFYGAQQSSRTPGPVVLRLLYGQELALIAQLPRFRHDPLVHPTVDSCALASGRTVADNDAREPRLPQAQPGGLQLVGDGLGFVNYGFSPYSSTSTSLPFHAGARLDVSRSYFFNFGGFERWAPQFSVQIEK
jgi:hypothetical protein